MQVLGGTECGQNNKKKQSFSVGKRIVVKNYVNKCEHISLCFSSTVLVAQDEGIYLFDEVITDGIAPLHCRQRLSENNTRKNKLKVGRGVHQVELCYAEIETHGLEKMNSPCIRDTGPRLRCASQ